MEVLEKLIDLISNNFGYITIFSVTFLLRGPISELIKKVTTIDYKNDTTTVGIKTKDAEPESPLLVNNSTAEKPTLEEKSKVELTEPEQKETSFAKALKAAELGDAETAKAELKIYVANEGDSEFVNMNRGMIYYRLFASGKYDKALDELEVLKSQSSDEQSIMETTVWLSLCFSHTSQHEKGVELWRQSKFKDPSLNSSRIIHLSQALLDNGEVDKARKLLIDELKSQSDSKLKSVFYRELSSVEGSEGDKELALLCSDRALQLNPTDKYSLFDVAYEASEIGLGKIALSNYYKLLEEEPEHDGALNNIAVIAQNQKKPIIAVNNYQKSSDEKHTLAMANLGYILLNAGFASEAEAIADKAIKLENPHNNIYQLKSAIHERREEQEKEWNENINKANKHQSLLRTYTEAYYESSSFNFAGEWFSDAGDKCNITVSDSKILIEWLDSKAQAQMKLTGIITLSTFKGVVKIDKEGSQSSGGVGILNPFSAFNHDNVLGVVASGREICVIFKNSNKEGITFSAKP